MLKRILLFILIISSGTYVHAQTDSAAAPQSPVKTLTYEQYNALMKGEDLYNMALPATLNGYPMPDAVIKYKFKPATGKQNNHAGKRIAS
jgi:hypothetical protein